MLAIQFILVITRTIALITRKLLGKFHILAGNVTRVSVAIIIRAAAGTACPGLVLRAPVGVAALRRVMALLSAF
jgi:hypothetical protein